MPLVLGGVRIDHPRGLAGHSDGDVLAHALTDAVLGAAGMEDIGALFPSGDPALEGADSLELLREAWRRVTRGGLGARERRRRTDRRGAAARAAPGRDARAARGCARCRPGSRRGARDDHRQARLHRPRRRARRAGRRIAAAMKLRIYTHAERDLRGTMPNLWPEFMNARPGRLDLLAAAVRGLRRTSSSGSSTGRRRSAYACTLPVRWDGMPEQRGLDWAMSNGVAGEPTTLCAVVAGDPPVVSRHRASQSELLQRMSGLATAHGLDCLIAPVRPTWKERYPLTPIERYVLLAARGRLPLRPVDPHARAARRRDLSPAPKSMTVTGSRERVGGVDGPRSSPRTATTSSRARSSRCASRAARAPTSSRTSGCGIRSSARSVHAMAKPLEEWTPDDLRFEISRLAEELARRASTAIVAAPGRAASTSCDRARTGCAGSRGTRRSRRRWSRTSSRSTSARPARSSARSTANG